MISELEFFFLAQQQRPAYTLTPLGRTVNHFQSELFRCPKSSPS